MTLTIDMFWALATVAAIISGFITYWLTKVTISVVIAARSLFVDTRPLSATTQKILNRIRKKEGIALDGYKCFLIKLTELEHLLFNTTTNIISIKKIVKIPYLAERFENIDFMFSKKEKKLLMLEVNNELNLCKTNDNKANKENLAKEIINLV